MLLQADCVLCATVSTLGGSSCFLVGGNGSFSSSHGLASAIAYLRWKMNGYVDMQAEAEAALSERQYRRRRVLSTVRGWLRSHASPRWLAVAALSIGAMSGALVATVAWMLGMSVWGPARPWP